MLATSQNSVSVVQPPSQKSAKYRMDKFCDMVDSIQCIFGELEAFSVPCIRTTQQVGQLIKCEFTICIPTFVYRKATEF